MLTGPDVVPVSTSTPFQTWQYQRLIVNCYYQSLVWPELSKINICQKTWDNSPYGREKIFYGETLENQNMLTTNATAILLHSIMGGVAISRKRSQSPS